MLPQDFKTSRKG
jgi:hypothetical protein